MRDSKRKFFALSIYTSGKLKSSEINSRNLGTAFFAEPCIRHHSFVRRAHILPSVIMQRGGGANQIHFLWCPYQGRRDQTIPHYQTSEGMRKREWANKRSRTDNPYARSLLLAFLPPCPPDTRPCTTRSTTARRGTTAPPCGAACSSICCPCSPSRPRSTSPSSSRPPTTTVNEHEND